MEKYELLKKIGEGTYGIVYKAQNKSTGTYVAIKKFKDSDDDEYVRKTALREIRILKQLKHDHIVDLLEVFREDNRIFLVFEQLNRTILDELQGRNDYSGIEPLEAKKIIWQMLKACDFMHSHNIVHRDFKPENMLLSRNGVLKICDFGFARQLTAQNIQEQMPLTEYVSTRWYRAPELLVGAPTYTHAVDVWAIGCIFVELVTGSALFTGDSDFEMLKLIMQMFSGSERLPQDLRQTFARNNLFKNVQLPNEDDNETVDFNVDSTLESRLSILQSNAAVSFARECLRMDPQQRPTAEQLLEHDYFNDFQDWFEDEIQTLMEYDQQEMQQGVLSKQRESALKTRRIENLLGENPVASQSQPNSNLQSQSMSNPFFANSLKQSQQISKEGSNHSPLAPRNSGTPIRESRMMNIGALGTSQRNSNADTPTLNGPSNLNSIIAQQIAATNGPNQATALQHGQQATSGTTSSPYPGASNANINVKQSSFGSVIYDSNRKTREINTIEENRLKQASSLSPTRMIQDMSRQDATSLIVNPNNQSATQHQLQNQQQANMFGVTSSTSTSIQKQLPTFNNQASMSSQSNKSHHQSTGTPIGLMNQQSSEDSKKLYSVVIKEDPEEQLSPTFHVKKGFFQMNNNTSGNTATNNNNAAGTMTTSSNNNQLHHISSQHSHQQQSTSQQSGLNRNSDLQNQKQKTFRERERERLNNESQNSRGRSVTKININFNGEGSGNPMTSSGTNLNIPQGASGGNTGSNSNINLNHGVGITSGSPRVTEDNSKFYGSKLYASNSSAISGIQTKKTLQSTNSTSNLESGVHQGAGSGQASVGGIITKGAYYPTMRQKQARDNQLLLGLSTIQSNQYQDLSNGVMGIGYSNQTGAGSTITKTQPNSNKVSIPNASGLQSINFPSFDEDNGKNSGSVNSNMANSSQLSSLIQLHNSSNATLQASKKSIQGGQIIAGIVSPASGISPKGQYNAQTQQLLAPSSSSYQFPLQALGQGLTTNANPSKEQPRLKAMMLRNQSSSSTQPLGHSLTKPINSVGSKNYNSTISNQHHHHNHQTSAMGIGGNPGSSHGANSQLNENNQNIANQKSFNQDGSANSGQVVLPKPNVKIVDLQHNLLPFDSGLQGVGQLTTGVASSGAGTLVNSGGIASSTGQQIISDGGIRIDAQSLKNQLKQGKKDATGGQLGAANMNSSNNLVMSHQQHYLLQQIHNGGNLPTQHHQLPQSSHNGMVSKQQNLLVTPKTPNEIYGVQQKAILHQIFNKGGGPSRSKVMTRHTTPFHQSFGVPGKMTTSGGSNPKLVTMQQLIAVGEVTSQSNSKGALISNNVLSQGGGVNGSGGGSSVPGGNRPGANSSGATIKKNGSMGLGAGMGSYAKYNQHHHMSSQLQANYKQHANAANGGQSIATTSLTNVGGVVGSGGSGTITTSHSNQQQILLAATHQISGAHPGSGYGKPANSGLNSSNSVRAAYGHHANINQIGGGATPGTHNHLNQISKLSPTGVASRLSQGANTVFPAK